MLMEVVCFTIKVLITGMVNTKPTQLVQLW